eukprot:scpid105914/ scgid12520/ 
MARTLMCEAFSSVVAGHGKVDEVQSSTLPRNVRMHVEPFQFEQWQLAQGENSPKNTHTHEKPKREREEQPNNLQGRRGTITKTCSYTTGVLILRAGYPGHVIS